MPSSGQFKLTGSKQKCAESQRTGPRPDRGLGGRQEDCGSWGQDIARHQHSWVGSEHHYGPLALLEDHPLWPAK
eukprot:scaffold215561_cov33-Prasinocladus_malaysianus.AAC.1